MATFSLHDRYRATPEHFPDAIDFRDGLHGTVFHIYAPKDLPPSTQKKMRHPLVSSVHHAAPPQYGGLALLLVGFLNFAFMQGK